MATPLEDYTLKNDQSERVKSNAEQALFIKDEQEDEVANEQQSCLVNYNTQQNASDTINTDVN